MKKTLLFILAIVLIPSMIFAGGANESKADTPVEISMNEDGTINNPEAVVVDPSMLVFWSLFSGGDGEYMDRIIDRYNATNPSQQVKSIMLVWDDYYTKLQTAVATKNGPDMGISHASKLPELVDQGVVIALDKYIDELGIDMSIYSPNSLDAVTFDGEIYAIPLDTHAEILYYNTDILARAGIEPNEEGHIEINGINDFMAICDQIKPYLNEGETVISITNSGDDPYRTWWATYFQMGGTPLVNDAGDTVTIDRDIAIKAGAWVKSLYDDGYVIPGIVDHQQLFQAGKAAFVIAGTWIVGVFEQTQELNFGAQPWPQLFDYNHCWADSHTLILPVNPKRTEEETLNALDAIFNMSSSGGLVWAESGQIPSAASVLTSEEYLSMPYRKGYNSALQTAVMPAKNENFYAMKASLIECLNALWAGYVTPEQCADNIIAELNDCIL